MYAQIKKNKNKDSEAVVCYFYGEDNKARSMTRQLLDSGIHPLSFLAGHGFIPIKPYFFYKEDAKTNL